MEPQPTEDKSQRSSAALKGTCTNEALSGIRASTPHRGDIWPGPVDAHVPKMSRQPALTDSCSSPSLGAASHSPVSVRDPLWRFAHTTCICSPISALTSRSSEWETSAGARSVLWGQDSRRRRRRVRPVFLLSPRRARSACSVRSRRLPRPLWWG